LEINKEQKIHRDKLSPGSHVFRNRKAAKAVSKKGLSPLVNEDLLLFEIRQKSTTGYGKVVFIVQFGYL